MGVVINTREVWIIFEFNLIFYRLDLEIRKNLWYNIYWEFQIYLKSNNYLNICMELNSHFVSLAQAYSSRTDEFSIVWFWKLSFGILIGYWIDFFKFNIDGVYSIFGIWSLLSVRDVSLKCLFSRYFINLDYSDFIIRSSSISL